MPPLIVVILAMFTRRILLSLSIGIMSAALIACDFVPSMAINLAIKRFWDVTEFYKTTSFDTFWTCSNLFIVGFLLFLGILITMIQVAGAAYAYGNFVAKKITTKQGAEYASLLLSTLFFIDDYFSCLTVGSVMQPITDRFNIPRAKLALLAGIVVAPLATLFPISSWVAEVVGQFRNSGISSLIGNNVTVIADPFSVYLMMIICLLYPIIMLVSVIYIIGMRVSYGVLAEHDFYAQNNNLLGGKAPLLIKTQELPVALQETSSLADFLVPIFLLFTFVLGWIFYTGGWFCCGGTRTLLEAVQNANIYAGLFVGGMAAVVGSCIFLLLRKRFTIFDLPSIIKNGVQVMGSSIFMLFLIWTFSSMLSKDLETGQYLAQIFLGKFTITLLPAMFFLIAALISTLIGTAWGTIGMLIPLVVRMVPPFLNLSVPLYLPDAPILLPVLGAIISGSIVGNHLSPVADIMVMASMSAGAYHLDAVKSFISIALPTACSSLVAFLSVGYLLGKYGLLMSVGISIGIGIVMNIILLHLLQIVWQGKKVN